MSRFRVGDVCEFVGLHERCQEFNGTECCVLDQLAERYGGDSKCSRLCHTVRCAVDGVKRLVEPQYLRLRRPPEWNEWLYDTTPVDHETDPETDTRIRRAMRDNA